jgi:nucleotide-binding universal stress UspA family protein
MIEFNRVLFPVDFSKQCRIVAPAVAAVAARLHARLQVLHVLESPLSYYPVPAASTPKAVALDRAEREQRVRSFELFVADFPGTISAEPILLEGDPAQVIACYAAQNAIDLIMMPTHGYSAFRRMLLGSVTAKVLHDATCPVWTAPHDEEIQPQAEWGRFLCAVDETARDGGLLRWAAQFALEQHADLQVVHAVAPVPSRPGAEAGFCDLLFDVARRNLADLQTEAGTSLNIHVRLGPVGAVVHQMAIDCKSDLILVGRGAIQKRPGGLFSHAYAIIREAPCPVISL